MPTYQTISPSEIHVTFDSNDCIRLGIDDLLFDDISLTYYVARRTPNRFYFYLTGDHDPGDTLTLSEATDFFGQPVTGLACDS